MSCILDIDLDYFRLFNDPIRRLDKVLGWARRPVDVIVDEHHKVLKHWDRAIGKGVIEAPTFILHVDEHHDMLSEQYITASFRNALELSLTRQTRELESDTYTKMKELEKRINERLDTILGLLETRQEPELLEDKSAISVSSLKSPAGKEVLNAPTVRPSHQHPNVRNRQAQAMN